MAESAKREPACPESCRPGRFGTAGPQAGITFSALTRLSLIDLRGDPQDPTFVAAVQSALGAVLPLTPNTVSRGPDCEVLWLGPDEWLIRSRRPALANNCLEIAHGAITDVSSGRAAWQLTGPRSVDLLAKGCSLDLHPRAFANGSCAQTALAHVAVLLHRRDTETFDIYCARSYAGHVWHWLQEAALEYGYEVAGPLDL